MRVCRLVIGACLYLAAIDLCSASDQKSDKNPQATTETSKPPAPRRFKQPKKPYLSFSPFVIPILDKSNPYRTVYVRFTLKLKEETWHIARVYTPYIYHNLFKDLYYAFNFFWRGDSKPNPEMIRKRLLDAYNRSFKDRWPIEDVIVHEIVADKEQS